MDLVCVIVRIGFGRFSYRSVFLSGLDLAGVAIGLCYCQGWIWQV